MEFRELTGEEFKKIENANIFVESNQSANSIRNLIMKALKGKRLI